MQVSSSVARARVGWGRGGGGAGARQSRGRRSRPLQRSIPGSLAPWPRSHLGASAVSHNSGHQGGQKARPREDASALWGMAAWQSSYWGGCIVTAVGTGSGRAEGWVRSEKRPPKRLLFPEAVFTLRQRGAWAPRRVSAHSNFCLSVLRRPLGCARRAGRRGPGRVGGQRLRVRQCRVLRAGTRRLWRRLGGLGGRQRGLLSPWGPSGEVRGAEEQAFRA